MSLVAERVTTSSTAAAPPLRAIAVSKTYRTPDHIGRLVLENIDFTLHEGEIVAVLGKSGAGKSTFLRILAGLLPPSLGHVELGLEAQGVSAAERRRRAVEAIDIIGLDGFESAYPKELSGGMQQRVSFARALVVNPDILLLDEPFSQLDVLTAETLRNDLLDLWVERRIPTKGILIVSHNIEEAVELADRILVFSSDPGRISAEIA